MLNLVKQAPVPKTVIAFFAVMIVALMGSASISAQSETAYVRFAHFAPDVDDVSIELNGEVVAVANFADVSVWLEVPAGDISALATILDTDATISVTTSLATDERVTVAFIGVLENDTLQAYLVNENYSETITGEMRLSIFHAIAGAPPVDVFANDTTLVQGLAYPDSLIPDGDGFETVDLLTGTYDFSVQIDGTTILNTGDIVTGTGRNYLFALVGTPENPQYVFVSQNIPTEAMAEPTQDINEVDTGNGTVDVRAVHLVSGADAVDVYVNGELVAEGLAFISGSPYLTLPSGVYTIGVAPTGDSTLIAESEVALVADNTYSIGAVPDLTNGGIMYQVINENSDAIATGETRLAVIHSVPDLGLVNLVANDTILLQGMGFPGTFPGSDGYSTVDIAAGDYLLQITAADGTVLFDLGTVTLGANTTYLITVAGYADSAIYTLDTIPAGE